MAPSFPIGRIITVTRRKAVYEIADDAIDLVCANFRKALANGFRPKSHGRVPLIMPVLLKTLRQRQRTITIQRLTIANASLGLSSQVSAIAGQLPS